MTESVVGLEVVVRAVLELDPHEVTVLRRGSAAELKGECRSEVGCINVASQCLRPLIVCEHVDLRTLASSGFSWTNSNMWKREMKGW